MILIRIFDIRSGGWKSLPMKRTGTADHRRENIPNGRKRKSLRDTQSSRQKRNREKLPHRRRKESGKPVLSGFLSEKGNRCEYEKNRNDNFDRMYALGCGSGVGRKCFPGA